MTSVVLMLSVVSGLPTQEARSAEQARIVRTGQELLRRQTQQELHEQVTKVAESGRISAGEARVQLEAWAVWQTIRSQTVLIDLTKVSFPDPPTRETLGVVGRIKKTPRWNLNAVDAAIEKDRTWLAKAGNNATNAGYVEDRVETLEAIRSQVASRLRGWMREEIAGGDEVLRIHETSIDQIEQRGRVAESKLGSTVASGPATEFRTKLGKLRDLQRRKHRLDERLDLENTIKITAETAEAGTGDYVVCVVHLRGEYFGGYGTSGKKGQKTHLSIVDKYVVVTGKQDLIANRKERWSKTYSHDWCRRVINSVPNVVRYSMTYVVDRAGISSKAASIVSKAASDKLKSSGYGYTHRGYAGPQDGLSVPFTIPRDIADIPACKR